MTVETGLQRSEGRGPKGREGPPPSPRASEVGFWARPPRSGIVIESGVPLQPPFLSDRASPGSGPCRDLRRSLAPGLRAGHRDRGGRGHAAAGTDGGRRRAARAAPPNPRRRRDPDLDADGEGLRPGAASPPGAARSPWTLGPAVAPIAASGAAIRGSALAKPAAGRDARPLAGDQPLRRAPADQAQPHPPRPLRVWRR